MPGRRAALTVSTASVSRASVRRARAAVGNAPLRELAVATLVAVIVVALLFGSHIRSGGLESDDWALFVATKFPGANGYTSGIAALAAAAGSRVGAVLYWLFIFSLFGTHAKLYLATGALITVAMAASFYVVLRVIGFSRVESGAMMVVSIALPSVDTTRLWIIAIGGQLCFVFVFLGLAVALRAFDAPPPRRLRLHLLSLALYTVSAAYAEIAMPLVAIAVLLYVTRASVARSVKRWLLDLVIVATCYAGTVIFVNGKVGFDGLPRSQWLGHARAIYAQALTIFSGTLVPFADGSHAVIIALLAGLALAGGGIWRWRPTASTTRRALRRWSITFGIAVVAAIVGWGTYVPANAFYSPLQPGLSARINIVAGAPLAVAVVAVIMFAKAILTELVVWIRLHRWRA